MRIEQLSFQTLLENDTNRDTTGGGERGRFAYWELHLTRAAHLFSFGIFVSEAMLPGDTAASGGI